MVSAIVTSFGLHFPKGMENDVLKPGDPTPKPSKPPNTPHKNRVERCAEPFTQVALEKRECFRGSFSRFLFTGPTLVNTLWGCRCAHSVTRHHLAPFPPFYLLRPLPSLRRHHPVPLCEVVLVTLGSAFHLSPRQAQTVGLTPSRGQRQTPRESGCSVGRLPRPVILQFHLF